jgi:hypothetical protein
MRRLPDGVFGASGDGACEDLSWRTSWAPRDTGKRGNSTKTVESNRGLTDSFITEIMGDTKLHLPYIDALSGAIVGRKREGNVGRIP